MEKHLRQLGFPIGQIPTGRLNAITDVPGVQVGHATLISGEGLLQPGKGPVRTGVTVILPHGGNLFENKVRAAVHTINGFGKVAGFEQVRALGQVEAPLALTNTLNVGRVLDALVEYSIRQNPEIGISTAGTVNIVVGETNDGYLNDIQGRHVRTEHVLAAFESASGDKVPEGNVGAGTGTRCMGWKGGIGTASRVISANLGGFCLGVLVQTNFGRKNDLQVCGFPVGRYLSGPKNDGTIAPEKGSVMVVLATDAPLSTRQLKRLCIRVSAGLARVGSYLSHGSGDFVVAFSTTTPIRQDKRPPFQDQSILVDEGRVLDFMFRAVVESVEEAVINSLTCAETMVGRDGNTVYALPVEEVLDLLNKFQVVLE
jgi:D-aminopeptidase